MNKELRIRNIYVDYFCWWYDFYVCGVYLVYYLYVWCWWMIFNEVYNYFLVFDFYMFVICDLCNVLFYFMFFEICLCWIKFLYLNYIVWNVMILLDDNVNWLFFYFFFCGERCNSDVNIVNGKIKYDVI